MIIASIINFFIEASYHLYSLFLSLQVFAFKTYIKLIQDELYLKLNLYYYRIGVDYLDTREAKIKFYTKGDKEEVFYIVMKEYSKKFKKFGFDFMVYE